MQSSILLTLGALATTLAMPTSPSTELEKRATVNWSLITALYCQTEDETRTTSGGATCYSPGDLYWGIVSSDNTGCNFEFFHTEDCSGTSFYEWDTDGCCVPGGVVYSVRVTC
ncbi:hypothetical protein GGR57DRAFT_510944 [Xylariaceae sp. FL1272]|nr:hypothetical protein GGR57DRAFT_510944 [Xylariaceae sp. FL1272]